MSNKMLPFSSHIFRLPFRLLCRRYPIRPSPLSFSLMTLLPLSSSFAVSSLNTKLINMNAFDFMFRWGSDVIYSSMIVSDDFNRSPFARDAEFTTNSCMSSIPPLFPLSLSSSSFLPLTSLVFSLLALFFSSA